MNVILETRRVRLIRYPRFNNYVRLLKSAISLVTRLTDTVYLCH